MFQIKHDPTFKTKVQISIAGSGESPEIEVEYRYLTRSESDEFHKNIKGKKDVDSLGEIIVNWSGPDLPYSAEALGTLLDLFPAAAGDLYQAFRRELLESKTKN